MIYRKPSVLTLSIECGLSVHQGCAHLVPDFCGMSMEVANQILTVTRETKDKQGQRPPKPTTLSEKTLRPGGNRPTPPPQQLSYKPPPREEQASAPTPITDPRRSHGQEELYIQPPATQQYPSISAAEAAKKAAYGGQGVPQPRRPQQPPRTASSQAAIDAASSVMGANNGKRVSQQRSQTATDVSTLSGMAGASGYSDFDESPSSSSALDPNNPNSLHIIPKTMQTTMDTLRKHHNLLLRKSSRITPIRVDHHNRIFHLSNSSLHRIQRNKVWADGLAWSISTSLLCSVKVTLVR